MDKSLTPPERNLNLEEKASLMSGKDFWSTQEIEGSGIPSLFLADGPHGVRKQALSADHLGLNESLPATAFPTAATMANSWDPDLGEEVGRALGREASSQGVNVLLGPGLNIKRSPRCGRNFEYFSEDPYLAGKMAAAYVRGIQSQGVAACLKHFAANNQETGRMTVDTVVDGRTLREIYLTGFEIAVQEGRPWTLMTSYNRLNGTYTNEHRPLLEGILRGEWGFDGLVVTDWGGSNDRVDGLVAGSDLEMPTTGGQTNREIVEAVRSGRISEATLDRAVERLRRLAERTTGREVLPIDADAHHRLAQRSAEESIVLLKNEGGLLPLASGTRVALIGDFARSARYQGAGSSIVNPTRVDQAVDVAGEMGWNLVGFEPGFERYGRRRPSWVAKARALAAQAEVVLLYLGLDEVSETEGLDRETLGLPANQLELLEAVADVNPRVVVVLSCGSVVEMPWIDRAQGLVHGYLGGQAGARAMLRVIAGQVNPSGRLAETHPLRDADTPAYPYFPGREATVEYREGLFVGYRYYDTGVPVLFPFGFGLSYTRFEYSDLRVDAEGVTLVLTNVGDRPGREVVQLYVGKKESRVYRPRKELKGFQKVSLAPGESRIVRLAFDGRTFRYWDLDRGWELEGGEYTISVGASSADIRLNGVWTIPGSVPSRDDRLVLPNYFQGRISAIETAEFEALLGRRAPEALWDRRRPLGYNDTIGQCQYAKGAWARVAWILLKATRWVLWNTGNRSAANLIVMSVYNLPFRGIARMTGGAIAMATVDGLLLVVNGHAFRGFAQVLGSLFPSKKSQQRSQRGEV